ncbi:hypothetical protein SFA35_11135 [Pseudomonas sp. HR96]|uniref:hypothetical protein n=1 Tax=Pseudomonas sp. HR96 TaxID=1027966 RepID=UPI002A74EA04|nr:hypothetical protein [Pseudomonas sp. HR96]WPP01861.1 hypothetical protein SFA35_11135 [Pseudomonas sp. HR96]
MSKIITQPPHDIPPPSNSSSDSLLFGTPKERLDFYRKEIQYETAILSNRTNAYLSAQSFLVIAYCSSMGNLNPEWGKLFTLVVPPLLAMLGLVSSMHAWPGIRAAYEIIDHWHFKQSQLLRSEPAMGLAYDDSPLFSKHESSEKGYRASLMFSLRTPWLFSIFWCLLGGFSVYVQYTRPGA